MERMGEIHRKPDNSKAIEKQYIQELQRNEFK